MVEITDSLIEGFEGLSGGSNYCKSHKQSKYRNINPIFNKGTLLI